MKSLFLVAFNLLLLYSGYSQSAEKTEIYTTRNGAIDGFDAVAYFTNAKPVKGAKDIVYEWKGATWYFSSEENKAAFVQNPEKYAPQYGGYCAYGWSNGYAAKTEGNAWTIVDNKLYLNYSLKIRTTWEKDIPGYITKADAAYQKANR